MDLGQINIFKALNARMHWLNERQRVLAQNVANADTPNYRARDVTPLDFRSLLNKASEPLNMQVTHKAHQGGTERLAGIDIDQREGDQQTSPTGNSVILEEEMMKVAQTAHDYELMTNLYRKGVGMLRIAMSRPRG